MLILDIADCKVSCGKNNTKSNANENTIPYHSTNVQSLMWTMMRILMMLMVLSVVSSYTLFVANYYIKLDTQTMSSEHSLENHEAFCLDIFCNSIHIVSNLFRSNIPIRFQIWPIHESCRGVAPVQQCFMKW